MNEHLVYIDQNVIGLQLNGKLNLHENGGILWVYSEEHFSEIKRSNESEKYLKVLNDIGAKLLAPILNEDKIPTDKAEIIYDGTPFFHYQNYIEANNGVDFDDTIFDPLHVWLNGGGSICGLKGVSNSILDQVHKLTPELHFEKNELHNKINLVKPEFDLMVDQMISNGNDILKTRAAFGDEKGSIGSISGERQIEEIWEIVSPIFSEVDISCDQFFGFESNGKQESEQWPVYLGIISCCAIMDILGFQSEKKCRKINKLPNVKSDSIHIAMGAYCSAILSEDERLIKRAKAIYEYKGIGSFPILIERSTS